ncbi:hypothetical protein SDC9_171607 [bioreactor metagenome]|uniref:Uncharacterized protein n=1 Tax=bioreactor metagenome TaxID=1076179 RepID=A0A645GKG6_9ZZZZ
MSDLSAAYAATLSSFFPEFFFCKLPEVTFPHACKYLVSRNVSLNALKSYPFRQDSLYVCNEFCRFFVGKSLIFPSFPHSVQRCAFGHKCRINLQVVRSEARIFKEFFKSLQVEFGICSRKVRHHMKAYFKCAVP